ncbi:hypothetical protein C482_20111 [Natrialba chahannaoensis JCM 10990]|uniref:Uncharacterized protein n=1 Tax=Natrialba chahannaoensis JCM 10990 TaxID=1227492 RepID=M0A2N9_9EURY|nr:hypothetical protein [Natrialba chahannaoensis]ELY93015.1 hypothetical protein C482_20111 [Natrialba chahannaoensis JCM 10990]
MASQKTLSRRTALRTLTTLATGLIVGGASVFGFVSAQSDTDSDGPADTERYVAVVDRIVDGEHVVLLLEEDGQLVDELVVPRSEFDTVSETDILAVIIADDELIDYRILPERPCDIDAVDVSAGTQDKLGVDRETLSAPSRRGRGERPNCL